MSATTGVVGMLAIALAASACTRDRRARVGGPAADAPSATPASGCTRVVAADLLRSVRDAVDRPEITFDPAPPLPADWPDAGGRLVFFVYKTEPRLENTMSYDVEGPTHRIVVAVAAPAPQVETLRSPRKLGIERSNKPGPSRADMTRAEQALADIVAGCRSADDAATDLRPYARWLDRHDVTARDLEKRAGAFIAWLKLEPASARYKKDRHYASLETITRSLRTGMSKAEVEALLGPPVYSPTDGQYNYSSTDHRRILVVDYRLNDQVTDRLQHFDLMTVGP